MEVSELKKFESEPRGELDKLPNEFDGTVEKQEFKKDARGKDCLYVTIKYTDGAITQKYSGMHIVELVKCLSAIGIVKTEELVGNTYVFKRTLFPMGNARWMPVQAK